MDDYKTMFLITAARSNMEWVMNISSNQDWTTQRNAIARDDLRKIWGAKVPVWEGWDPLDGPRNASASDPRKVFQIFVPYNMTRLPFDCNMNNTRLPWRFTRLPEEMMLWPVLEEETCLKYVNTDASIWGLESCWTQWPRDNSWENPYLHFKWSQNPNYTYSDVKLKVMTLATSPTTSYYDAFVQRTFRNMTYYGWPSRSNKTLGRWHFKNVADWPATPWAPSSFTTSYNRTPTLDWAWRYTGSFWYSNFHFPMVTEMTRNGDYNQGTIRGRQHWGNNQCIGQCGGV
jgi:hypothetical protein